MKYIKDLSPPLNRGINLFAERLDMDEKNQELFYDIINFSFNEGRIKGKEDYLNDIKLEDSNESED